MAYLIRSADGRLVVCTPSPRKALDHVRRLRAAGTSFTIVDANGKSHDQASLAARAKETSDAPSGLQHDDGKAEQQ